MLQRRILSAAVLIAVAVISIVLDVAWPIGENSGAWMIPLFLFATLGTIWEMSILLGRRWLLSARIVLATACAGLAIALFPTWYAIGRGLPYPVGCPMPRPAWILFGVLIAICLSGLEAMRRFPKTVVDSEQLYDKAVEERQTQIVLSWLLTVAVTIYVVGLMSVWYMVRASDTNAAGMAKLISILAIIKFSDAGAYFMGKLYGRTKLASAISPGKTVEGLIGGLLAGILVSYLSFRLVMPLLGIPGGAHLWGPAVFGISLTVAGLVGDLLESMIKRAVGAKDSGTMLPGLGGVWDVTDSLLPTSIVGYLGVMAQLT